MSKLGKKKFFHSPIIQDLTYVRLILNSYERKIGVSRKANVLLYGYGEYWENRALEYPQYKKTVLELQHALITKALRILKLDDPGWPEYATIDNVELMGPMILAEKNPDGKYDLPAQFHGLFDVVLDGSVGIPNYADVESTRLNYNLMDARNKDESVIILCGKRNDCCQNLTNNYTCNIILIGSHTLLHIKKKKRIKIFNLFHI
jgi:hypothetical protein